MARIRSIKPDFYSDRLMSRLGLRTRLFYTALWTFADDDGRGRAIPKELAGYAFPHEDVVTGETVADMLDELAEVRRIVLYRDGEDVLFSILNFRKHQRISKPTPSKLPEPPATSPLRFRDGSAQLGAEGGREVVTA